MRKGEGRVLQVSLRNEKPSLPQLESEYLHRFPKGSKREAVRSILALVYENAIIDPFDGSVHISEEEKTHSSLLELMRFFVCAKNANEMPYDAPIFLRFLKKHRFKVEQLCRVVIK